MKNHNQYLYKRHMHKLSMGTLVLGSLLVITGCNNSLINSQPTKAVDNKPIVSKTENPSLPQIDSDYSNKDYAAADDSASTPEGIKAVVKAKRPFIIQHRLSSIQIALRYTTNSTNPIQTMI